MKRRLSCSACLLDEKVCNIGSQSGCCPECAVFVPETIIVQNGNLFGEGHTLGDCLLHLATSTNFISSISDDIGRNILSLEIHTAINGSKSHAIDLCNHTLQNDMDQMVWEHYTQNIRGKHVVSGTLTTTAIFVRGYLSLLFATTVIERRKVHRGGSYDHERLEGFSLSFQLTDFILSRLHALISEIMDTIISTDTNRDKATRLDVAAAVAILHSGLIDIHSGLTTCQLKPICGDEKLANVLRERISSTLDLLHQCRSLTCQRDWESHLKCPLASLRSSVKILSMILTLETRVDDIGELKSMPKSTQLMTLDLDASALIHIQQSVQDAELGDYFASMIPEWSDHIDLSSSNSQGTSGYYSDASGSLSEILSLDSDITNSHAWDFGTIYTFGVTPEPPN